MKNRFLSILLSVALLLSGVESALLLTGRKGLAKSIIGTVLYPFSLVTNFVGNGISGFILQFQTAERLQEENEQLKEEVERLEEQLADYGLLEEENERLRNYLGFSARHRDFTLEEATVTGVGGSGTPVYTLNKGTEHGIREKMPVVDENGNVFGYVSDVALGSCTVVSILHDNSSVGVTVPRSAESGILSGNYALSESGYCLLEYLPEDADVAVGDVVRSSGGSVYPADLPVGEVIAVSNDVYTRSVNATVKPYATMDNTVRTLLIITDYN